MTELTVLYYVTIIYYVTHTIYESHYSFPFTNLFAGSYTIDGILRFLNNDSNYFVLSKFTYSTVVFEPKMVIQQSEVRSVDNYKKSVTPKNHEEHLISVSLH